MNGRSRKNAVNRRDFLTQSGSGLLAASIPVSAVWPPLAESAPASTAPATRSASPGAKKKIPIGVFDPVYDHLTLDAMLHQKAEDRRPANGDEIFRELKAPAHPFANHGLPLPKTATCQNSRKNP